MLAAVVWDPNRNLFVIPGLNHPLTWYGVLFALGFFIAYFFIRYLFAEHLKERGERAKLDAVLLADRLAVLAILGTIVGARLGHVFFYGWPYYRAHLLDIFKVWEGGLASHGGAVGVMLALVVFYFWHRKRYPTMTFLALLDAIVIPTAFVGGCIRVGNFMNQEILGTPTNLPWGVIFKHPIDGPSGIPLHPAQLYESLIYFASFAFLVLLWQKLGRRLGGGLIAGLFFLIVFGLRFLVEFVKYPQSEWISPSSPLNMGQILSIPFITLGIALVFYYFLTRKRSV